MDSEQRVVLKDDTAQAYRSWKTSWKARCTGWTKTAAELIGEILFSIRGEAQKLIEGEVEELSKLGTVEELFTKLDEIMLQDDNLMNRITKLLTIGQGEGESFAKYAARSQVLLKGIFVPEQETEDGYKEWNQKLQISFFVLMANDKMRRKLLTEADDLDTLEEVITTGRQESQFDSIARSRRLLWSGQQ